mmetsp:Transcript_457/g.671  ORF Transcript_457/g.671 Transcript_457/m.671 type:complete len:369 (+) Transcript_457:123-1229(+)|eukprot:CAMPEP_0194208566 /NCGR_PEP_ID=MMETSP0156-20130528/6978_1 /TAXON_ID=33649 /ORGANISM="Thalassionema nitzschioides, Strain L26-B" /LENGTH=368 /DNA_ID=CAMNT_0038935555 /DNA_START=45 /DNA_END=1151 /DNA_ORIENTATION=-
MSERNSGEREQEPLLQVKRDLSSFNLEDDSELVRIAGLGDGRVSSYNAIKSNDRNDRCWNWGLGYYSKSSKLHMKILLFVCYTALTVWTTVAVLGPIVLSFFDELTWCTADELGDQRFLKRSGDPGASFSDDDSGKKYENPDYDTNPCRQIRIPYLFWLTLEECDYCQRMIASVLLGGTIGYERRSSDRAAGIRTMGLVCLGACFYTIASISAFKSSTMGWDASRVTAALPSGVGFLGAALIWKGSVTIDSQEMHQVHGLTTAASVWLSAAIGVGTGGALYFVSGYSTILIIMVLRFGPRLYLQEDDNDSCSTREVELPDDPQPLDQTQQTQETEQVGQETLHPVDFYKSGRRSMLRRAARSVPTFHG